MLSPLTQVMQNRAAVCLHQSSKNHTRDTTTHSLVVCVVQTSHFLPELGSYVSHSMWRHIDIEFDRRLIKHDAVKHLCKLLFCDETSLSLPLSLRFIHVQRDSYVHFDSRAI